MLLSLSDLLLSTTLFINAGAVLNFKISQPTTADHPSLQSGIQQMLASLRVFRIPLALWNLTMVLLMVIWFPG